MSLGLTELTTISLALSGAALMGHGFLQDWRMRRKAVTNPTDGQEMEARIATMIQLAEARISTLVNGLDARQKQGTESLRSDIAAMKSELDWLTGERMIEQAIAMVRSGVSAEDISADLGISIEAAQTIRTVRRH